MKRQRVRIVMLAVAVVSLLVFAASPAWAAPPSPPTGVTAQSGSATAAVLWTPGATNGNTITGYTLTPSPACGGCTGLTTTGATSTSVGGLTNGTAYTFTVVANSSGGDSGASGASNSVTPHANSDGCGFDSFPSIPGSSSELAIRCTLTTATGGAGTSYRVEDLPFANWHSGAGRGVTTTAATAATSAVITASAGHFAAQDVNDVISGPGIPSNTFIKAVTATTATLNKAVGSPGVATGAKLTVNNSDGRTVTATTYGTNTITAPTGHFCKAGLTGCNSGVTQKNDVGRIVSGTRIPHGSVITAVNTASQITISQNVFACPAGVTAANCNQVGISSLPTLSTSRQIKDATFISPNKVCSASARFTQTDVNLPIASVGAPSKFPAGDYITAVGAGGTGCTGNTFAVLKTNYVTTGTNTKVFVGGRSSDAPINGDAIMSLGSELSVSPGLSAGLPNCTENSAVGSNLVGKWLNPGSFDTTALGQPASTTITGPVIAQLDVTTGTGNPAFAGYVMLAKAGTAGDSDTAAHVDIVFPALLTGTAVCPAPSDVGIATTFRFFGETLSQSAAGSGDVRDFQDLPAGTAATNGSVYEHILQGVTPIFTASGSCMISFPTTRADYSCSGT
jgi:hypothetical protein